MRFEGKVALITGGGRGIGKRLAAALAAEGCAVALLDVDLDAAESSAAELADGGGTALAVGGDVADDDQLTAVVGEVAERLGGIDILVNNAAKHLLEWNRPVTELPPERWRQLLDVNVIGVVNSARACRPHMASRGGGVILNMSSIAGFQSVASYGISKLAVRGLTVALADELAADGIRVVGIAPGATESESALASLPPERFQYFVDKQLIKRRGTVDDLIGPMLFLCSDEAAFITGETLIVGGGFPLRV
jgi:3-oxoacyl-[acyl-carrier protein] reductase